MIKKLEHLANREFNDLFTHPSEIYDTVYARWV